MHKRVRKGMKRLAVRNEQKRKTPEKCPLFLAWFIQSHPLKTYNLKSLCPMQDTACLGLMHGDDPEGCYGERGGRGVHVWERIYTRGGFMSMYGETNTIL